MGQLTRNSYVVKMKNIVVGIGRRMDGIYTVDSKKMEKQQALAAPEKYVSVLHMLQTRFGQADRCALSGMAGKDFVCDTSMRQHSVLVDCSRCIEGTVTNKHMPLKSHVEVRPGGGFKPILQSRI